jgi:hypothetical protein
MRDERHPRLWRATRAAAMRWRYVHLSDSDSSAAPSTRARLALTQRSLGADRAAAIAPRYLRERP